MKIQTEPFDHIVLDGYWDPMVLIQVRDEMPAPSDPRWRVFANERERKLGGNDDMLGPTTRRFIQQLGSEAFCEELQHAFGIGKPLMMDTYGGGYHCIPPGGYLDMHVDFNTHPNGMFRRLNLLVYLNDGWIEGSGGELILRSGPTETDGEIVVPPMMNRMAVFATSEKSWHGHPKPTIGYWRRSIAAYYYSEEPPSNYQTRHDTIFS